jgi:hypothetical protein
MDGIVTEGPSRSRVARRALGALSIILAAIGCLDDTLVAAGSPNVRATLSANVVGAMVGGTVRIRVGYRTSRQQFVALPSSPEQIDVAPATTVVLPLTVDIGACLADDERAPVGEAGCRLVIELTLSDASGGVVDSQTREATGEPVMPGGAVNFGAVTIGVTVSTVAVAPSSVSLTVSQEQLLTATVRDAAGAVVTSVPVSWSTTDATVAQLTATSGSSVTVRALKLGSATIRASANGKASNDVRISVIPPPPLTIRQREGAGCALVGGTINLEVDSPPGPVVWSSGSPNVATIGAATGAVVGLAAGSAVMTATSGNRTGTATVCVTGPLRVTAPKTSLVAGEAMTVTTTGTTGGTVSFASNATSVATVDAAGIVRGVGIGQATITATLRAASGSESGSVSITVSPASVAVTPTSASAALNATTRYAVVVRDVSGAMLPGIVASWSITDATIGSLSGTTGVSVDVRALKLGTTTVRATVGGVTGTAQFTAVPPLPPARLEKVSGDGAVCPTQSTSCTFVVRAVDVNGVPVSGASVSWVSTSSCSASKVVTTDANGLATSANMCSAVGPGTYTQTATLTINQQQVAFTYSLRGLLLWLDYVDSYGVASYSITSATPASGLSASVVYRSGPVEGYVSTLSLDRATTPAILQVGIDIFSLPYGVYTLDVIVSTTTPGLGPAVKTITFDSQESGYFVQPSVIFQRDRRPAARVDAPRAP